MHLFMSLFDEFPRNITLDTFPIMQNPGFHVKSMQRRKYFNRPKNLKPVKSVYKGL